MLKKNMNVESAGLKNRMSETIDQDKDTEKIWCPHEECFKYLRVCNRCRLRIKCQNYQDYWFPRLDF